MKTGFFRFVRVTALASVAVLAPAAHGEEEVGLGIQLYPGLSITGVVGQVYAIQWTANLDQTNGWISLTNIAVPTSPYLFIDTNLPATARRFYRAFLTNEPFVLIPPGTFLMGSPTNESDRAEREGPQTMVVLRKPFYMAKTQVTQGQYLSLMSTNPSFYTSRSGFTDDLERPVETVSWYDAQLYCAELTRREQDAGQLPTNWVYRLPTEAEWEYACRAGTTTQFSFGDAWHDYRLLDGYAWHFFNASNQTHPVGRKLPNPWGLYDMHGNVTEWCQSYYGPHPGGTVTDPTGPSTGERVVVRNGSWAAVPPDCRSASRNHADPSFRWRNIGFRVVKSQQ